MRTLFFLTFFYSVLHVYFAQSQNIAVNGLVQSTRQEALAYANIGIVQTAVGTVSDPSGKFTLHIPPQYANDSVVFAHVGFVTQKIAVADLRKQAFFTVVLQEKSIELKAVEVNRKQQYKPRKRGTTGHNPLVWGTIRDRETNDIREFAHLIRLKELSEIVSAHVFLRAVSSDSAVFRINFYASNNGKPGERIVEKEILVRKAVSDGWLDLDLQAYKIYLETDFFVALECLPVKSQNNQTLYFGGQLGGGTTYSRKGSMNSWTKSSSADISFYVRTR